MSWITTTFEINICVVITFETLIIGIDAFAMSNILIFLLCAFSECNARQFFIIYVNSYYFECLLKLFNRYNIGYVDFSSNINCLSNQWIIWVRENENTWAQPDVNNRKRKKQKCNTLHILCIKFIRNLSSVLLERWVSNFAKANEKK